MAVLGGKLEAKRSDCAPLAGKSTLNRLELSRAEPSRYHKISYDAALIEAVFVDVFLDAHAVPPPQITLDLDATDDPLHGHQEGRFFHGYYDNYCYLPLYVFCGRHLLASKLRPANIDGSAGSVAEMARIIARIRQRWPGVRILLRADSGFAREALMAWCEDNAVDFLFGLARNTRLSRRSRPSSPPRPSWARRPASRPAASGTSPGRRATAGAASAASSPRPAPAKAGGRVAPRSNAGDGRGQPALRRHLAEPRGARGPPPLREALLRPRRDGKPHQGMPARPLCRTYLGPDAARQPAAAVVRLDGLCADLRLAPHRPRPYPVRPGVVRHHPSQAAEDRGLGARQRAPHQTRHAHRLPLSGRISRRARRAERRCDGLTNQTALPPFPLDTSQEQCPLQDSQKLKPIASTHNQRFLHVLAPPLRPALRKSTPL